MDGEEFAEDRDRFGRNHDQVAGVPAVERRPAPEVFALLADESRIAILESLGDPPGVSRSFSELFESVDVDDSGNFSYHLNKLLETFVREEDGEYGLTYAGKQVVGSIHAGTYTADATVRPTRFGGTCQICGGELVFEYADELTRVYCEECRQGRKFPFPSGCLREYEPGELPAASARWYRTHVQRILDGFCPVCSGPVDGELVHGVRTDESPPRPSLGAFDCKRCGNAVTVTGATIATFHPVVEGFLFEHGFDTRDGPHSEVWDRLDDSTVAVCTSDPLTIEVTFTHAGEAVVVVIGQDATVASVERRRTGCGS